MNRRSLQDKLSVDAILAECNDLPELAVRRYSSILKKFPQDQFAFDALEEMALEGGRLDALEFLGRWCLMERPEKKSLIRTWMQELLRQKRTRELEVALSTEPAERWPWLRVEVDLVRKRLDKALGRLELLLQKPAQQEDGLAWSLELLLRWVELKREKPGEGEHNGEQAARKALEILSRSPHLPASAESKICQARLFWLLDWDDDALSSLDRALELDSLRVDARLLGGRIHLARQDWDQAQSWLRSAASQLPGRPEILDPLAFSLIRLGRLDEALGIRRFLVEAYPSEQSFWVDFSNLLQEAGRHEESLAVCRQALELFAHRSSAILLNNTAYLLAELERELELALELANRALSLDPESPFYLDSLGWIQHKMGQDASALAALTQALIIRPADTEILDHIGHVQRSLNNYGAARQYWEQALELDPGNMILRVQLDTLPSP